ncbi:hypothetical protein [Gemmata sp.]|uniref:hypothetical protein n=1 Tax=Gemmata sp. TaxID=1914242 RepID=UPI003F72D1AE
MFAATRWSVRTLATVAALGLASAPASAQFGVVIPNAKKAPQPVKANQVVVPAGPKVPQAGVPRQPQANRPVLQPSVNSFPGFPTYPAANPWNPALNNPFASQGFTNPLVNPRPFNPLFNPLVNNNPLIRNPLVANPLVNNNPFVNPLANPFIANPLLANPLAINPLVNNPFAPNPLLNNPFAVNQAVGFAPPVPAHQPGTLVYKGPNTFVNNATGAVVQPVTGTTFADGTTYYRPTGIDLPNFNIGVFTPYIW